MGDENQLVSIVIPVFNRAKFIEETIQSALNQSYPYVEVVVSDNSSTDGTWELLQKISSENENVRIYRNESNIGPVRNWIKAVSLADGYYTKILWSDDQMDPEFVSSALEMMAEDVGFCMSAVAVMNLERPGYEVIKYSERFGKIHSESYIHGQLLESEFSFSPGNALFRTADLLSSLQADIPNSVESDFSQHAIGNDLLLLLKVACMYKYVANIQRPLNFFLEHPGSISLAAKGGKVPLHYLLTKSYFVERYRPDYCSRLAALIKIELLRRPDAKKYNMRNLGDFFSKKVSVDYIFLFSILYKKITSFLMRKINVA